MKSDSELKQTGFTASGAKRYLETLNDYADALYAKSVLYAQGDKAPDTNLEVTHEHVRAAAHRLTSTFGRDQPSGWTISIQILEYIFTAFIGVGGSSLKESWGMPLFVISVALVVIFFVVRQTAFKR